MLLRLLKRRLSGNRKFRHRGAEHRLALEIPLSRKELHQRRRHLLLLSLKWSALIGSALWLLFASGQVWERTFRTSPDFAVGPFELITNGVITTAQVTAATGLRQVALAGGVAANSGLRAALLAEADTQGWAVFIPDFEFCTDNAAMVAMTAHFQLAAGDVASQHLSPDPRLKL